MAWVTVGARKINTANVCYMEQKGENLLLHFHGQWEGNPLELVADEAKALWRFLKCEDLMAAKDKGSAMVLPKRVSAPMPVLVEAGAKPEEKKSHAPSGGHSTSQH